MSRRALIAADVLAGDPTLPTVLLLAKDADVVIVARNGTVEARVPPQLKRLATYTVTRGIDPDKPNYSAFDGGTLRPIESLESILAREKVTEVVVCGYIPLVLQSVILQTAFDANALGYPTTVCLNASVAGSTEVLLETIGKLERAGIPTKQSGEIWTDATG